LVLLTPNVRIEKGPDQRLAALVFVAMLVMLLVEALDAYHRRWR
jgi:hypothetical protein